MNIPVESMNFVGKLSVYCGISGVGGTDYLNFDAVFSDESACFVSNAEPELNEVVVVKLRTAASNVDAVFVDVLGKDEITAKKIETDGIFDYYAAEIKLDEAARYFFRLEKCGRVYFYNKRGLFHDVDRSYDFRLIPGFKTPDWAKGAVIYQIFVDRFCNGDKANDVVDDEYAYLGRAPRRKEWDDPVMPDDVCNFYGGDLQGIMDKLDYLAELGVEALYLNPVFVSPSSHKYDAQDYDYIDPHFGVIVKDGGAPLSKEKFLNRYASKYKIRTTDKLNLEASNALMAKLIEAAHAKGIKVILDGVFNHCGAFNKWLDKEGFYHQPGYPSGAYRDKDSIYNSYFRWYNREWPNNDCYDGWWGHDNHPKLAFEDSPELYEYIMGIAKKWVSPPFCADGWRLDVAADLGGSREFNHKFWKTFRDVVKSANKNAVILAEHYGNPDEWLNGGEWDSVMNYDAFMEPVTWFLTGMEKHSEHFRGDMLQNTWAFEAAMRYHMARMPFQSLQVAMNELSNHDHSRFLTRTNRSCGRLHTNGAEAAEIGVNRAVMMTGVLMQMTWPGSPTIYYGDEAGLCGWTDPDNRRPFPWGREDEGMLNFHKAAVNMRKSLSCLRTGSLEFLRAEHGVLAYGRWDDQTSAAIAVNATDEPKTLTIPVWRINVRTEMKTVLAVSGGHFDADGRLYHVADGSVVVTLPEYSGIVLSKA